MACMFNKGENCIAAGEYYFATELVKQYWRFLCYPE